MRSRESRPLPGAPASRPPLWAGLLVVLLIGTLGFTWLSSERAVTLVLDGEAAAVRSHAATVGDLLARSGVEVGPHDVVQPDPDTLLTDGMVVEHVRAREITLLVGDVEEQVLVTALSVDEVLAELGFAAPRRALVRPSRSAPVRTGMVVELDLELDLELDVEPAREPVALTVVADGSTREVITDEGDVGELLERLAIDVGPADRVIPGPAHPTEAGIVVTVQRVTTAIEIRREPIPHDTQERRTDALPSGERRQVRAGADGVREITEEVVRVDGAVESRTVQGEQVVRDPQDAVVEVGTAAPAAEPAPAEPAPAEPAPAPSPSPTAEAAAPGNVEEGGASWYDNPYGGMTAAHKTIPRGTIVKVTNLANGKSVKVRINDRGPYVDGRIIDLNREAFAAIATVSRGVAQVRIEW